MAYFDHQAAARQKERADKYDELKKYITSKDENGKMSEWILAHQHIVDLENELEQSKKQIEEYQNFFSTLQSLLPRVHSIHDVIG